MKKDLEWLKEEVNSERQNVNIWQEMSKTTNDIRYYHGAMNAFDKVVELIDQLDTATFDEGYSQGYKKGKEHSGGSLPEIPSWFAIWFEDGGYEKSVYGTLNYLYTVHKRKMNEWAEQLENGHAELQIIIAEICDKGIGSYTVEEKKYYILLPKIKRNWRYVSLRGNHDEFIDHYTDSIEDLQAFTEKEIKAIEPRYFAFAVPVKELEE